MLSPGQQLRTNSDFDNAMQVLVPVQVIQKDEILDCGAIEVHNQDSVRISGLRYLKAMCIFKIK